MNKEFRNQRISLINVANPISRVVGSKAHYVNLWLQAVYLMCSSKNGVSSHQLMRTLDVQYKTAWFMTHCIREAMVSGKLPPMGGVGVAVEFDETYIGRKPGTEVRRGYAHKNAAMTLVQRGGSARSFHVDGTRAVDLLPIIKANVLPGTSVMMNEAGQYAHLVKHFAEHGFTRHAKGEYVVGDIHTYTVEGFYSYQHCAERHLHRYVAEFDFRYNNQVKLGVNDQARTLTALRGAVSKRLTYRGTDRYAR